MPQYTYTVRVEPAEEGGFVAIVPRLPGCQTQGNTYEETLANAKECIEGFLEALLRVGREIPIEDSSKNGTISVDYPSPVS